MDYTTGYILFGVLFLVGGLGYWIVTRAFRDPSRIYETAAAERQAERAHGS